MSHQLKTLIVFDTNSLRSTDAGEVAYSFFAFGRPFQVIEEFIIEQALTEDIHIAIPTWAIEELKDQKQRQYKADVLEFEKLAKRLSGLPHIGEIAIPNGDFDCATYVEEKATEYILQKSIKLLEVKEEIANTVLRNMMSRVMREENKKAPFANSGKYRDAGFKDNVVWESLMNFEGVANYNKVIFLTKDGDFNKHCEDEFRSKWVKHISILKDENNVLADLLKDYGNYIDERSIHEFAQTEYFHQYLYSVLNEKTLIEVDQIDQPIITYSILDWCKFVERLSPDEDGDENVLIKTIISVEYKWDDESRMQEVEVATKLLDDKVKEIIETTSNYNLTL